MQNSRNKLSDFQKNTEKSFKNVSSQKSDLLWPIIFLKKITATLAKNHKNNTFVLKHVPLLPPPQQSNTLSTSHFPYI